MRAAMEYNSQAVEGPVVVEPASNPGVDGPGESGVWVPEMVSWLVRRHVCIR